LRGTHASIDDREARRLLLVTPKAFNSEFNTGMAAIGGAFYRKFGRERIGKTGIRSRRRLATKGKSKRSDVSVPNKVRALGFTGRINGKAQLAGKSLVMYSGSPVTYAHEFGATITPRRKRFLAVKVTNVSAARRAGVQIARGAKPKVLRVRKVVIKARLGFYRTWASFRAEANDRLHKIVARAKESTLRLVKRGTA
jgi:hypothetical protein